MYYEEEIAGRRAYSAKKLIRVTFPDGTVYCYKNATVTFTEALRKLGADKVAELHMEWRHQELCCKEPIKGYEKFMKPLDNGWLVNTQNDSTEKYTLLRAISEKLGIDCKVEIGTDFETSNIKGFSKTRKAAGGLLIQFADGEFVGGASAKDSYIAAITRIGPDMIFYKGLDDNGMDLITRYNKYKTQVQVGDKWVTVPGLMKDKVHALEKISQKLNLGLTVTVID